MTDIVPVDGYAALSFVFTNFTGEPADPTTVAVTVTPPAGPARTIADGISRASVGAYSLPLLIDQLGLWIARWQGSGAIVQGSPNQFINGV